MAPEITCQPMRILIGKSVEEGLLIFADGALVAVVSNLMNSVDEPDLRGRWYLESGFGPCEAPDTEERLFDSPNEAQQWVLGRMMAAARSRTGGTPTTSA